MNRKKFKNLNDEDRIQWIFDRYKEGYSTPEIVKLFGIPKNTIGDTMRRNGFIGNRTTKKYEFPSENGELFKQESFSGYEAAEMDNKDKLIDELISWYQLQKKKESEVDSILLWAKEKMEKEKNIKNVPKIDLNIINGDLTMESFTVYDKVLKEFDQFCDSQELSKAELLSMAMVEYINKYK